MSDLPATWARVRLDSIADVRLGRQRSPKNHTGTQMRPYLRAANIDWQGLKLNDVKQMNFTDEELVIYRLEPGDLLLSEASGSPHEVGKPALWTGPLEHCCFQNTLIRVRAPQLDERYLLHYFRWQALSGAFAAASRGVGIHHLGAATLSAWPVPVPPMPEQRRIVEALEHYLSRLDVAGKLVQDSLRKTAALRRAQLATMRHRALRAGARMCRIDEAAETSLGKMLDAKRAAGIATPYLRNINVRWGRIETQNLLAVPLTADERDRFSLSPGDLLVCEGGEPGRCAVWDGSSQVVAYQKALHRLRPRDGVRAEWLALMIEDAVCNNRIDSLLTGTTIRHLPQERLRELGVPIPEVNIQDSMVGELKERTYAQRRLVESVELAEAKANAFRKSLLHRAYSGHLVPQDSNDDPASVLLERVVAERASQEPSGHGHGRCAGDRGS